MSFQARGRIPNLEAGATRLKRRGDTSERLGQFRYTDFGKIPISRIVKARRPRGIAWIPGRDIDNHPLACTSQQNTVRVTKVTLIFGTRDPIPAVTAKIVITPSCV